MSPDAIAALLPLALIAAGALLKISKLVKDETFDQFPAFLFSVCYPCIILQTIGKLKFGEIVSENAYAAAFSAAFTFFSLLIGLLIAKHIREDDKKPVAVFAAAINNSTYVGLPIAQLLFGARGVAFMIIFGVVQDLFVWTVGYRMFSREKMKNIFGAFKNPVMASVALALALSIAGAPRIPIFDEITQTIGSVTVPLALLYLGCALAKHGNAFKRIKIKTAAVSAIKIIFIPAAAALILNLLPVDDFHKNVSVLAAALPVPLLTVVLSVQFEKNREFAVELLLCSTIMFVPVFFIWRNFL